MGPHGSIISWGKWSVKLENLQDHTRKLWLGWDLRNRRQHLRYNPNYRNRGAPALTAVSLLRIRCVRLVVRGERLLEMTPVCFPCTRHGCGTSNWDDGLWASGSWVRMLPQAPQHAGRHARPGSIGDNRSLLRVRECLACLGQ
jgi:hypothetical protein